MKLYEIAADYRELLEAIEAGEIPEESIEDTLESITTVLEDKADNIACFIKNLTAEVDAIKAEEQKLAKRRKAKERQIVRVTNYLANTLLASGYTSVETTRNKISFRGSEAVAIPDERAFIEWATKEHDELLTYGKPTVNRTAVKAALDSGAEISGAYIERRQNIQIN